MIVDALTLTSSLVAGGDRGDSHIENAGHMYVVPFFLSESMYSKNIHHQALAIFSIPAVGQPAETERADTDLLTTQSLRGRQ